MWGYYGSKSNLVDYYPEPECDLIIEPFAGTAQYSLKYWDRNVILVDKYETIINLWKWLQVCSEGDILGTRRLKCGENVDDFEWDCQEQKDLVGFIITGAPTMPKKTASRWKTVIRPNTQNYKLNLIASNLRKIRHWDIRLGSYEDVPNQLATWFVDPPYKVAGKYYKHSSKSIDYSHLAHWSKCRIGQTIVCENVGADWLPFNYLTSIRGAIKSSREAVWLNAEPRITSENILSVINK
jgi:site-specific DNA-adenine methylase